jgi:hypothetical protein
VAYDPLCGIVAGRKPWQRMIRERRHFFVETPMWVLLIYVVLMIAGDVLDVGIGALASNLWGDPISLPIFLACYFITLAVAWVLAVKIAESMKLTT